MKKIVLLFIISFTSCCFSQELLADVSVDFSAVQTSNTQVFKTLQKELKNFINNTKWTDKKFQIHERIQCAFFINITERTSNNNFKAILTVQSRRPIYGSNYFSPTLNFQDKSFSFEYVEFEQLIFNERKFSGNNLTDVLAFYIYLILGNDADTFSNLGGTAYYTKCQKIAQNSENQNYEGWSTFDGLRARSSIITEILKPASNTLRETNYLYHIRGLDQMNSNEVNAKNAIMNNLLKLDIYENNLKSIVFDIFLSAKKQEIVSIFSAGTSTTANVQQLKELLEKIDPTDKEQWDKMKN